MNLQTKEGAEVAKGISDHFALFGIERRFAVDLADLEARYHERQKEVHPDRFVNASAGERVAALSATMQLNDAYKCLKRDRSRAEHLLALSGVVIGASENLDPSFLMSILEAREELAEALAQGDAAGVSRLEEAMLDRRDAAMDAVASLFAEIEAGQPAAARLAQIKRQLIVLRYVDRYLEAAVDDID